MIGCYKPSHSDIHKIFGTFLRLASLSVFSFRELARKEINLCFARTGKARCELLNGFSGGPGWHQTSMM